MSAKRLYPAFTVNGHKTLKSGLVEGECNRFLHRGRAKTAIACSPRFCRFLFPLALNELFTM